MATTTFQGVVRSYSGKPKGTVVPGVMIQSVRFSCNPTATAATNVRIGASATTGNTLTLPAGCIPISVVTIGAASTASGTIPLLAPSTSAAPPLAARMTRMASSTKLLLGRRARSKARMALLFLPLALLPTPSSLPALAL